MSDGTRDGWLEIELQDGQQAIVNGALVCADGACRLRIAAGAQLHVGDMPQRRRCDGGTIATQVYYETLQVHARGEPGGAQIAGLLDLLARAVSELRTCEAQRLCARYAQALAALDLPRALDAARALALADRPAPPRNTTYDDGESPLTVSA